MPVSEVLLKEIREIILLVVHRHERLKTPDDETDHHRIVVTEQQPDDNQMRMHRYRCLMQVGGSFSDKAKDEASWNPNCVSTITGVTGTSSSRSSPLKVVEPENAQNSLLSRDTDEEAIYQHV